MIFAVGAPESFAVPWEVNETLDIAISENGQLIAVVTSNGVYIWSGGAARVLLGHVTASLDEHDVNWRAIWSSDSSRLAVLTLGSAVLLLEVLQTSVEPLLLELQFGSAPPTRPFVPLPPLPRVEMRQVGQFHVGGGVACATLLHEHLLVLTKTERLVLYSWSGDVLASRDLVSVPLTRVASSSSSSSSIASMSSSGASSMPTRGSADSMAAAAAAAAKAADVDCCDDDDVDADEFSSERPRTSSAAAGGGSRRGHELRGHGVPIGVVASLALQSIAIVFANGNAVLLFAPPTANVSQAATGAATLLACARAVWVDAADATCVAFNVRHKLLSVGCANAAVHVFSVERRQPSGAVLPRLRTFSLRPWGVEPSAVGPVSCVRWAPDEAALAVGWQRRGLSVWSLYGCRLMCTVSQMQSGKAELAMAGVTSLCWSRDGFYLLIAATQPGMLSSSGSSAARAPPPERRAAFRQLGFVKNSLATNPTMSAGGRLLLLGADRLYYLTWPKHKPTPPGAAADGGAAGAGDVEPPEITWRHLPIPHSYLAANWPIQHVAVSRDGSQLAIAGERGLALYNMTTVRWKLFGDEGEERNVACRGLCWFGRDVVVVVAAAQPDGAAGDDSGGACELRFYPRSHLSERACLHRSLLPGKREPRFVDCNGLFLVLFTRDAFFYQYEIVPHVGPDGKLRRIETRLVHQLSMAGVAADPLLLSLLPPPPRSSAQSAHMTVDGSTGQSLPNLYGSATCLVLNSSGGLSLTNAEDNQQLTLASAVEQFWLSSDDAQRDVGSTLWAHGQAGVQVWFPFAIGHEIHAMKLMSRDRSLEFDLEVYPVGFVPELAVVVGIAQRVEATPGSNVPSFVLHTKTHPFLHSILRHLIETDDEERAFDIATRFASVPHFVHSFELLLHETLQDDHSSVSLGARSPTRPSTPQRRSASPAPPSLAAAAMVAAQQAAAAPPLPLPQQQQQQPPPPPTQPSLAASSVQQQRRASAAPLLQRVVEFLRRFPQFPEVAMAVARKMDVKYWRVLFHFVGDPLPLFQRCVDARQVHMAASYLRILQNISGVAASRRAALKLLELALEQEDIELAGDLARFLEPMSTPDVLDEPDVAQDDEEFYTQELLLGRYARNLLHHLNLRDLLRFARFVGHDVRPWLARERCRAATIADWSTALQLLHTQFDVAYPQQLSDEHVRAFAAADASAAAPSAAAGAGGTTQEDLRFVLGELIAARCFELALLVATVQLELGVVAALLRAHPALQKPFIHMLHVQPVAGYQALRELVQQQR